jgi:hypothetical protein
VNGVSEVTLVSDEDGVAKVRVKASPELRPALVRAVVAHGQDLLRLDRAASRLEAIFIQLAGGGSNGAGPTGGNGRVS